MKRLIGITFMILAMGVAGAAPPSHYVPRDLGTLPDQDGGVAYGINDGGQIVGYSTVRNHDNYAVIWDNGTIKDISHPDFSSEDRHSSVGFRINAQGAVLGFSQDCCPGGEAWWSWQHQTHTTFPYEIILLDINNHGQILGINLGSGSFILENGSMTEIRGVLPNGAWFGGSQINDRGEVAGTCYDVVADVETPCVWRRGSVTELETLPSAYAVWIRDINNRGQIVGTVFHFPEGAVGFPQSAVVWDRTGAITVLPTPPGAEFASRAEAINDHGVVVGQYFTEAGVFRALVWRDGQYSQLEDLPGSRFSEAYAINNKGDIVGTSIFEVFARPVVWTLRSTGEGPVTLNPSENGDRAADPSGSPLPE